jgi:hypothetical protein
MGMHEQKKLLARIRSVIAIKTADSEAAFAKILGVPQTTLNRNLKSNDYKQLMGLTGWILLAYADISRIWLLTGEGEMLLREEPRASAAAEEQVKMLLWENRELRIKVDELQNELRKREEVPTATGAPTPTSAAAARMTTGLVDEATP